ncbi:MAG: GntR family transcriptional regulator [Candidatus Hinthialibacter antarcticus]|nr:GntR family transcriptional regulator [Candidatus Hinthialibacter antarcticus]
MKNFDSLRVPKYVRLMIHLKDQIDKGVLKPGDPLATREKLMKEHEISLSTVTRAVSELERQGWLISRQGSGTFVAKRNPQEPSDSDEPLLVGLLAPNNCRFSQEAVAELIHDGSQQNIQFLAMFCSGDQEDELNQGRLLMEKGAQALVWSPIQPKRHVSVASLFGKNELPVILCEKTTDQIVSPWYCVRSDYFGGMNKALEHLFSLGHRRIAYFGPKNSESDFGPVPERWNAYKDAMKQHNCWDPDTLTFHPTVLRDWTQNRSRIEAIFRSDNAPTAVIGFNDLIALETLNVLRTLNLPNINDLALMGHSDSTTGQYCQPRLSTVATSLAEYVDAILRILKAEFAGEAKTDAVQREYIIPQRLILRESTLSRQNNHLKPQEA